MRVVRLIPLFTRGSGVVFTPGENAIMNVRVWLRGLGLGRYEEKFRENKIDFDVLADLTDGDLRELGVPLGDRRRLLRAIAEFGAQQLERLKPDRNRPRPPRPNRSRSWTPPN